MDSNTTVKSWGYEQLLYNELYCVKLLAYNKRIASSLHYHQHKHECFYVIRGLFTIELDGGEPQLMEAGQFVEIPAGTQHRVRCKEPGVILESSTHDDPHDCVRLIPSEE